MTKRNAKPKAAPAKAEALTATPSVMPEAQVPAQLGRDPRCLQIKQRSPEEAPEEALARTYFSPAVLNTITALAFVGPTSGMGVASEQPLDATACAQQMAEKVEAIQSGDTREIEQALISQAVSLQAIFGEMARRAALNMGTYIGPMEVYLRLALKAQSQARATLETLAEIKNPRPIFINGKQVNVANGAQQVNNADGPQQVNNGAGAGPSASRASENKEPANKLLEQ